MKRHKGGRRGATKEYKWNICGEKNGIDITWRRRSHLPAVVFDGTLIRKRCGRRVYRPAPLALRWSSRCA
eukprot:9271830-Pyramimonas_sp.AAC.2